MIRRATAVLLLALAAAGCGNRELHDRYVAERMFWHAGREAERLNLGNEVRGDEELERARAAYAKILERFPPERWVSAERSRSRDGQLIAKIAAESMYRQAELLASAKRPDDARALTGQIRRLFAREDVAVRATYLEALILRVEKQPIEAAALVASIPRTSEPVLDGGRRPNEGVLEAPLVAARWYSDAGDKASALRSIGEAATLYNGIIASYPGTRAALLSRVRLFTAQTSRGEWEPAIRTMEQILADSTFRAEDREGREAVLGHLRIADIYSGPLARPADALATIQRLESGGLSKELAPRVDLVEAKILASMGRGREGLAILDRVLADNPHDAEVCAQSYHLRAGIYEGLGDWERAVTEYRTLIRNYPRTPLGLAAPLQIAARYQRVGDREGGVAALARAIEDYRRVIELDPGSREALVAREYMAQAYAAQENWDQAAAALGDIAAEAAGTSAGAEALWREAWIYEEKMGQIEEAERRLQQIVSKYPDTDVAGRARERLDRLSERRPGGR